MINLVLIKLAPLSHTINLMESILIYVVEINELIVDKIYLKEVESITNVDPEIHKVGHASIKQNFTMCHLVY